jgi:hypothetical protein
MVYDNFPGLFLQSFGISSIGDVFFQWENLGIFDFILPFLLVFAIVFGILNATNIIGHNKGVSVIIAFVIGLMSIRYQFFFSSFLAELFPRLGVGIAVLITLLILVGLFIGSEEQRYWYYGLGAIGVVIAIIVLYQTGQQLGWLWTSSTDNVGFIVLAVLIIGIIIAVATSSSDRESKDGTISLAPLRIKER